MPNGPTAVATGGANPRAYSDNGDGTVTDNVTGLMWQQTVPASMLAWADALASCPTLTLAGHGDWRLPTAIELVSLVDRNPPGQGMTFDAAAFPGTPSGPFWTSTPAAGATVAEAWYVRSETGLVASDVATALVYVRCVR
jgi:hypothetical protein